MCFDKAQSRVWPFIQRRPEGRAGHDRDLGIRACNRVAMIGFGKNGRLGQCHSDSGNVQRQCCSIPERAFKRDHAGSNEIHRMDVTFPTEDGRPLRDCLCRCVIKYVLPV